MLERIDWNIAHVGRGDRATRRSRPATARGADHLRARRRGRAHERVELSVLRRAQLDRAGAARRQCRAVTSRRSTRRSPGCGIVDLMHRAGIPVDVVHAIVGAGPTGAALVDADVDMVCFTGSYATGQRVARSLADRLVRVQLELGGKDAAYVCRRCRRRGGRTGGRRRRVLQRRAIVQRHRAGVRPRGDRRRFVDDAGRRRRAYRVGDPTDDATDVGPLARAEQLDVLDAQVADAVAARREGAVRRRPHRPTGQLVRADRRGRRARRGPPHARGKLRSGHRRGSASRATPRRSRAWTTPSSGSVHRCSRVIGIERNGCWRARRRQRLLEHGRPLVRAVAVGGRRHSGLGTSMSESGVRTFVKEKAWHLKSPSH